MGAVTTGTPGVTYSYDDGADANGNASYLRLNKVTYPSGREIYSIYETTPSGRLVSQSENAGGTQNLVTYTYLGMGTIVSETHPQVSGGLNLSYGSGGTYAGWDRFGRIVAQLWKNDAGTTLDGYTYTYDRDGNRISRTNVLNSSLSETYSYDGLNRLTDANRNGGDLQSWGLDALGNWSGNTTSSGTQTRTSDAANEITAISGSWAQPTYDAAGNMTTIPAAGDESISLRLTYDAWNHVVEVMRNMAPPPYEGWVTFATYSYDGLGRLVNTGEMPGQIEFYYNENYQIIEQRFIVNGGPYKETTQYVWDQRYIDAPALAFVLEEVQGQQPVLTKYYFAEDANFDVTLRVKEDGTITGRAVYTPYGQRTVLSSTWDSGSYSIGDLGHQGLMLLNDSGATGMYYNRARFYHPTLGGFVQRDPFGYVDGASVYQYERSRPNIGCDPLGLWLSGIWGFGDEHRELLSQSLDLALGTGGAWSHDYLEHCSGQLLNELGEANAGQDSGDGYSDFHRHYNRALDEDADVARKKYTEYLNEEMKNFRNELRDAKRSGDGRDCGRALKALGRLTHSWQDYYAHAVLSNGDAAPAWTSSSVRPGSPDDPLLPPSSYGWGGFRGTHGIGEPPDDWGDSTGAEAAARRAAAVAFVAAKLKELLPEWGKTCGCYCD